MTINGLSTSAGVAEINVTLGLPRLIEIVDARKQPSTPMMTIALEEEYANDRDKARHLAWEIEATHIEHLADITTDLANMPSMILLSRRPRRREHLHLMKLQIS
ncbi:MAG: hypothetical protein R2741_09140 [Methanolobus sp.]